MVSPSWRQWAPSTVVKAKWGITIDPGVWTPTPGNALTGHGQA